VTTGRAWKDKAAALGVVLLVIDVCLFVFRWISFRALYGKHDDILVVCSEIGLIMSIAAFPFVLFERRTSRRVILAIASLVLGYFCLGSVAWWVMVK
jgi:hypothetical protein